MDIHGYSWVSIRYVPSRTDGCNIKNYGIYSRGNEEFREVYPKFSRHEEGSNPQNPVQTVLEHLPAILMPIRGTSYSTTSCSQYGFFWLCEVMWTTQSQIMPCFDQALHVLKHHNCQASSIDQVRA